MLARGGYGGGQSRGYPGVVRRRWGGQAELEEWRVGIRAIPVIRGPHAVVSWLAGKGIHHVGGLARKGVQGGWVWRGLGIPVRLVGWGDCRDCGDRGDW